jgi:anti-anti-sigma factor
VKRPTAPHLSLSGEIDIQVAEELIRVGGEAAAEAAPDPVEIDLAGVTFIDSSGLAALVAVRNAAREAGGGVRLSGVQPPVARVFELAGLQGAFALT